MTDSAPETFDAHAGTYEAQRRRLIPPYDAFYDTAVAALGLVDGPLGQVLDLGAGTGLLARRVRAAYPQAALTLLDGAPAMLEQARGVLGERARYVVGDLGDPLPAGRWSAVVSALAIHHLDDPGKRDLLRRVHAALAPGGVFVNAEQVAAPSPLLGDLYAAWHQRRARAAAASREEWRAARERMRLDHLATVEDQLTWLAQAGFADVDCLFKDHCFAVLVARRPATRQE
ncbi:MAG: tRNA (cmo5U34)-methyltransferase [Solirubrobacteraceae bacterium]|nr:tRNA (cmo5U34)-methyltransferase [Solirubrobacteraceae bacterium]